MLTTTDIKRMIEALKEVFYSKREIDGKFLGIDKRFSVIDKKLSGIQNSIDSLAKDRKTDSEQILVLNSNVKNLESWADKAGSKLGLKLER